MIAKDGGASKWIEPIYLKAETWESHLQSSKQINEGFIEMKLH